MVLITGIVLLSITRLYCILFIIVKFNTIAWRNRTLQQNRVHVIKKINIFLIKFYRASVLIIKNLHLFWTTTPPNEMRFTYCCNDDDYATTVTLVRSIATCTEEGATFSTFRLVSGRRLAVVAADVAMVGSVYVAPVWCIIIDAPILVKTISAARLI